VPAEFRLLGTLEASVDGVPLELPAAKPRALLALLLLARGRPVPQDALVEQLWEGRPPERSTKTLQVYVSQLRKALGAERIETRGGAYGVVLGDGELDAVRFEELVSEGRRLLAGGDAAGASERIESGLALWRGDALADFRYEAWSREPAARLEELRLEAEEARAESALALGRHAELIAGLQQLVDENPLRERLIVQLMLALYRSGRQADSLDVYTRARRAFAELGIEPSRELRDLHRGVLNQDPELEVAQSAPLAPPPRPRVPAAAAAAVALVVGAAVAAVLATTGGSGDRARLEPYVVKVENFLAQSREARAEIGRTVAAAARCALGPARALTSIDRVQRNRQSLLQQLAAADVPRDAAALRSFDLLQRAAAASIAADWSYRDWLRRGSVCNGRPPQSALRADARATRLKRSFVAVFDPLARRFGKREWRAAEF